MKKYEEMTVKELREETRNRGMKQSEHDRKFTKSELIENLKKDDEQKSLDCDTSKDSQAKPKKHQGDYHVREDGKPNEEGIKRKERYIDKRFGYIKFAHTIEEVKAKYKHRKPNSIYRYALKPEAEVIFLQVVSAEDDRDFFEKVRKARVISVDRSTETVKVRMFYGQEFDISYDDILYIKSDAEDRFPYDLVTYIRNSYTSTWKDALENAEFKN